MNIPDRLVSAFGKISKYCAYQERCQKEVRQKLWDIKIYGDDVEELIYLLIQKNYLNESRFASLYARSKFNQKSWGKNKIRVELKTRDIGERIINKALSEIDENVYCEALAELLRKKFHTLKTGNYFELKKKLFDHAYRKGFESHYITVAFENMRLKK